MIIDEKGKLFGKISILDIIVLLLVGGLVISFAFKARASDNITFLSANDTFYVTFRIERVRDFTVNAVSEGDVFYEQHASILGTVVDVWTEDGTLVVKQDDGTAELFTYDDKYDLLITLEVKGSITENGYYIRGNNQVSVGSDLKIQSNMIQTSGRVDNIY